MLSANISILWSIELIEKYEDKWNWVILSSNQKNTMVYRIDREAYMTIFFEKLVKTKKI